VSQITALRDVEAVLTAKHPPADKRYSRLRTIPW
jgi:hypothetical protein